MSTHEESKGHTPDEPYFVEVDTNGCSTCGEGRTYTVIGPDGYALGESWGGEDGKDHADSIADWMNMAYHAGKDARNAAIREALADPLNRCAKLRKMLDGE